MLTRDDFHGIPERWRPPTICGNTFEPRPREPRACHICGAPLPLIRHPNMSVCEGECQAENKRRIGARASLRQKKARAALKEEAVSE